jgi:hypothetical protein
MVFYRYLDEGFFPVFIHLVQKNRVKFMSDAYTYSVISTGQIHEDFGLADVQESFAKLFKTTPEKASKYVGVQKILKKDLAHGKAQALKSRLESIGMVIALKEHKPVTADSEPMALSIEERASKKPDTTMTCPKCDLQQEKVEQCSGCGVFIEKILGAGDTVIEPATIIGQSTGITEPQADSAAVAAEEAPVAVMTVQEADSLRIGGIAAAAIAAAVGALVWKYIAVIFSYEHEVIAWGIGAAVGIGASMLGSKGLYMGMICGVFALLAVLGGKYMAMESFQESWSEDITTAISGQEEEFKQYYQQDLNAAEAFSEGVEGKEDLENFLHEHGYTEIYEIDEITDVEIANFNEYVVPHLKQIAEQKPTFEQWLQGSFQKNLDDVSTMELVKSDIGIFGIIFFFLV